jgi:hypothetical protein
MTRFSLSLALAFVLLVPAAAAAAKPNPRTVRVQAPAYAHPGGDLPVRVMATATKRRSRATKVRVYVSMDRRRSKGDLALKDRGRLPALRRRGRASATVRATLPSSAPPGSRYVIGCAGSHCRPAKGVLTITASADPTKTSHALILADLAAGRISAERALTYRVFAIFRDERLPRRYAGDISAEEDDSAMRETAEAWPRLSKRARRRLARYLAPPPVRDRAAGASAAAADAEEAEEEADPCKIELIRDKDWQSVPAAGGNVRINWRKDRPEDAKNLDQLVRDVTTAYARFKQIMGREPLSDAKVACWHGKDGALDIYLDELTGAAAITVPSAMTENTTPDCDGMPSFIISNAERRSFSTRFILAHEVFHAFQNAFPYQAGCKEYTWFDEASANWAAHAAFNDDNGEHFFKFGLALPEWELKSHDYHAWPFVLWMEKTFGERSIRAAYEAFRTKKSAAGIDAAIGGIRSHFLDFAKHGWNQDPFPSFRAWDNFDPVPRDDSRPIETQHLFLAGQPSRTAYVKIGAPELGRRYKEYAITDERVKEVVFRNTLVADPDARIGAILRLKSGATRFDDWSGKNKVTYCLDNPAQDIASMVIVFANSSTAEDHSISGTPELGLRDRCAGDDLPWHFKVLDATLETHTNGSMPGSGQHFCGMVAGLPISGQADFKVATADDVFDAGNRVAPQPSGQLEGQIAVQAPAKWSYTLKGCEGIQTGGPIVACSTALERTPTPDGRWGIGFSMQADSKDAASATLTWWIPDPSVGFFDAQDSVCNVFEIWHSLDSDKQRQEIPLEQLAGTEPVTLTFHGNGQWTETQLGQPAHLAYDWTYKMTLQRVDENGEPL